MYISNTICLKNYQLFSRLNYLKKVDNSLEAVRTDNLPLISYIFLLMIF